MGVLRTVAVAFVHGFAIGFDIGVSFGCAAWFVGGCATEGRYSVRQ